MSTPYELKNKNALDDHMVCNTISLGDSNLVLPTQKFITEFVVKAIVDGNWHAIDLVRDDIDLQNKTFFKNTLKVAMTKSTKALNTLFVKFPSQYEQYINWEEITKYPVKSPNIGDMYQGNLIGLDITNYGSFTYKGISIGVLKFLYDKIKPDKIKHVQNLSLKVISGGKTYIGFLGELISLYKELNQKTQLMKDDRSLHHTKDIKKTVLFKKPQPLTSMSDLHKNNNSDLNVHSIFKITPLSSPSQPVEKKKNSKERVRRSARLASKKR